LVPGIRLAVSTTSRFSEGPLSDAETPETLLGLGSPTGHTKTPPPESCAAPATLMGFGAPTATTAQRSTIPRIPTPVRSAFRVSHPLDGLLPPSFPASRTGAAHGVHPSEPFPRTEPYAFRRHYPLAVSGNASSCSEDQEVTLPRSSRALLPARIRTHPGRNRDEPMLSWASCLSRAFLDGRGDGFPPPSLMRFPPPLPKEHRRGAPGPCRTIE
jgi:hypothetical protein